MVAARPFFIGSPGCVRSNACTWLFSSQHSTSACSGGDMYRPTMSSSFSTNLGSRETLKPRTRCGFNPWARQWRETLAALTPSFFGDGSGAPMGGRFGLALGGQRHQACNIDCHRWCPARQVALDSCEPVLRIALPPTRHLHAPNAQHLGDVLILESSGSQQHDPRALLQSHARKPGANPFHQLGSLFVRQDNFRGNSHSSSPVWLATNHWRWLDLISSIKIATPVSYT